ncbi:hypothetical protein K431DRAFT_290668 [Polychaeton citri CBS 116435]|uniref:Prion-inhibition and propagation HeLo domain-containing protein n=1 Tax=Polychaeton citri CBS 116435 TaxID=1314669 RepID=A0A9P4URE7_9PEZI|nr:hypothetical protein K431DRAFT_290668 [Polychaeton citri CBS 116435]
MATPIDVAGLSAQLVGLAFQAFQGCLDAYSFIYDAQNIGNDGDFARVRLQIEHERLQRWGTRCGLSGTQPSETLNWSLIFQILSQQRDIMTSAEVLKKRYNLILPVDVFHEEVSENGSATSEVKERSGLNRFLQALRPELYQRRSAKVIASKNGVVKRIRWAAAGRDQLDKIIRELGVLNVELERQLTDADLKWLHSGMSALLRELISRSTNVGEVSQIQQLLYPSLSSECDALSAAAMFKRVRLYVGADKRNDETRPATTRSIRNTMPALVELSAKRLSPNTKTSYKGYVVGTYSGEAVLVEWRLLSSSPDDDVLRCVRSFAMLLSSADQSFASLRCKGLVIVDNDDLHRYGLVYQLPALDEDNKNDAFQKESLYDIMRGGCKVALSQRFRIALKMCEAVLQLHTAGWLHKNIRSENVLFFKSATSSGNEPEVRDPYMIGYDNVRPDSLEAAAKLTLSSDTSLYHDLYRHPAKRSHMITTYEKTHDLYALACLLTEIALWQPLVQIFTCHGGRNWTVDIEIAERDNKDLALPSMFDLSHSLAFQQEIQHAVGPRYMETIGLCLDGSKGMSREQTISMDLHQSIVEKLRSCEV